MVVEVFVTLRSRWNKGGFFFSGPETDKRMRSKKFKISICCSLAYSTLPFIRLNEIFKGKSGSDKNFICINVSGENRKWRKKNWNPLNASSIKCLSSISDLSLDLTQFLRFRTYKNCIKESYLKYLRCLPGSIFYVHLTMCR